MSGFGSLLTLDRQPLYICIYHNLAHLCLSLNVMYVVSGCMNLHKVCSFANPHSVKEHGREGAVGRKGD